MTQSTFDSETCPTCIRYGHLGDRDGFYLTSLSLLRPYTESSGMLQGEFLPATLLARNQIESRISDEPFIVDANVEAIIIRLHSDLLSHSLKSYPISNESFGAAAMSPPPQVLVLPFPAQGHVVSFMSLSHGLVEQGFRITFVNTEFNHRRVAAAMSDEGCDAAGLGGIRMVAIPDGLAPGDDRNDLGKLVDGYLRVMPGCLEELITSINESGGGEGDGIGWMIADENMAWALEVAKKMGIRAACYWTASAAMLATMMSIPKMIREGILGADGLPRRHGKYQLSPGMPSVSTTQFAWNCAGDAQGQKIIFQLVVNSNRLLELAEFIICNTVHEMESPVFALFPNILPVGPLISRQRLDHKPMGHFWPEDTTCVKWLDEQPANSVIYVAFGSFTVFDHRQLQELALGLELSRRPFLWVVRPDLASEASVAWLDSFGERTAGRGKMVSWSPQQQILAHPSIACFLSHCGWNSTMEGVWNGVPFLCWPYFTDQFLNQVYICDVWKIGLSLNADDKGTEISREQIRVKLEELLGDEGIKARAMMWKDIARKNVGEGGSSYSNMKRIVEDMNGRSKGVKSVIDN